MVFEATEMLAFIAHLRLILAALAHHQGLQFMDISQLPVRHKLWLLMALDLAW